MTMSPLSCEAIVLIKFDLSPNWDLNGDWSGLTSNRSIAMNLSINLLTHLLFGMAFDFDKLCLILGNGFLT